MTKEIFSITQHLPSNILGGFIALFVTGTVMLIKKIVAPKLKQASEEIKKNRNSDKELLHTQKEIMIRVLHNNLVDFLNSCTKHGFIDDYDNMRFYGMMSDYNHLGGNTDRDAILKAFQSLPYKTTLRVPQRLGVDYPTEEVNNIMQRYYSGVMKGFIDETDVKPRKTVSREVNKGESKSPKNKEK